MINPEDQNLLDNPKMALQQAFDEGKRAGILSVIKWVHEQERNWRDVSFRDLVLQFVPEKYNKNLKKIKL